MPREPKTESKAAFARRSGFSRGHLYRLIAQGMPVDADGKIIIKPALRWIAEQPWLCPGGGPWPGRAVMRAQGIDDW